MDASFISALAALAGATIGGFTSVIASLVSQRYQAHAQWLVQEKLRRQELYKEFIEEASKCYSDALQHDKADIPALSCFIRKSAGCVSYPRQRSSKALRQPGARFLIPIWSRTGHSSTCV